MPDTPISLFISYAYVDSALVDRLEADLQKQGFDPWVDRHRLKGGQRRPGHLRFQGAPCSWTRLRSIWFHRTQPTAIQNAHEFRQPTRLRLWLFPRA